MVSIAFYSSSHLWTLIFSITLPAPDDLLFTTTTFLTAFASTGFPASSALTYPVPL